MNRVRAICVKAWAFVVRDFRIESGYKANFLMNFGESLMLLVFFYFLGELITPQTSGSLGNDGYRYFPFAIIGLAFARYFSLTLRMFSESIRLAQVSGCLEAMLSSQTGCVSIVLMSALYGLIVGGVQLLTILVAALAFGVDLRSINVVIDRAGVLRVGPDLCRVRRALGRSGDVAQERRSPDVAAGRVWHHPRRRLLPGGRDAAVDADDRVGHADHLLARRASRNHAEGPLGVHGREIVGGADADGGCHPAAQRVPFLRRGAARAQRGHVDALLTCGHPFGHVQRHAVEA